MSIYASEVKGKESQEKWSFKNQGYKDLKETFTLFAHASYGQFITPQAWATLGVSAAALSYSFEHDQRITQHEITKKTWPAKGLWEGIAITSTFPLTQIIFYGIGQKTQNHKLVQFAKETLAASSLALLESSLLSRIHIHRRPQEKDLNFWEKNFRGDSSWPSGHVIPLSVFTWKTVEHFGFLPALLPASALYMVARERVRSGKHFTSDVVGGIFVGFLASAGTTYAAKKIRSEPQAESIKKSSQIHWQVLPLIESQNKGVYLGAHIDL